jgi:hypothetical protein
MTRTRVFKKSELRLFEKKLIEERKKLLRELEYEGGQISKTQLEFSQHAVRHSVRLT